MKVLSTRIRFALLVLAGVAVLSGIVLGTYLYGRNEQVDQVRKFSKTLRNELVRSCERNGNPVRRIIRSIVQGDIENRENFTLFREFFPSVSEARLREIITIQNREDRKHLRQLKPLDCKSLYPILKG